LFIEHLDFIIIQISRLQQELDLQDRIRDEMFVEYNSDVIDENTKRKIQARIANVEEKVQALGRFFDIKLSKNKIKFISFQLH
jgi:hypothetical protein